MTTTDDELAGSPGPLIAVRDSQEPTGGKYPLAGSAGARLVPLAAHQRAHIRFGLTSILLHGTALAALIMLPSRTSEITLPNEQTVEVVFQAAEAPGPPIEPVPDSQPAPPPLPEPPPKVAEPLSVQPQPDVPRAPEPIPPKPKPSPPRPPVKAAMVQAVPRPVQSDPITSPLPVGRAAPIASAVATPTVVPPAIDPSWQASVSSWLASRKTYPEEARRRGEEGRATIRFTIDRSGRVLDATIVGASGSERLDEAALALLRQATLPEFPVSMTQARITITATIRYSLR